MSARPYDSDGVPDLCEGNWTIQRGAENQNMGWLVSLFKPDLLP